MQVTRAQVQYLRQWVEGKTPSAQVTMGETTTCASGVFVPIAEEKHHHRKLVLVTTTARTGAKVRVQGVKGMEEI